MVFTKQDGNSIHSEGYPSISAEHWSLPQMRSTFARQLRRGGRHATRAEDQRRRGLPVLRPATELQRAGARKVVIENHLKMLYA